jgi:ACS family tartrate transporter-like MFS transporter
MNTAAIPSAEGRDDAYLAETVRRKVTWRLVPFLALLYIFNILDRANVGFARLTMQDDLGMSQRVFDLGFGIFYFGYLVFEVPANLLLRRFGARRWLARIMVTWGLVTCATLAVTGPVSFYAVRILLGVAEAGFFPGIILYLTYWFPSRERVRVMAYFMTAISLAGVLGNPFSGAVMEYLDGAAGLTGWQWLFLCEGLPSVALGVMVFFYLPDGPRQARWLTPAERAWLQERMDQEEQYRRQRHGADLRHALTDRRVWLLIAVYFTVAVGSNASGAYFPRLIADLFHKPSPLPLPLLGASTVGLLGAPLGQGPLLAAAGLVPGETNKLFVGLLSALPPLCAIVAMTLLGAHSDRTGERRRHVAFAAFMAATGWALSALSSSPWLGLAGFCLAQAGMMSMLPPFWALPTSFLSGAGAAGGIALINSVANLGGLLGPSILGLFGLWAPALLLGAGAGLVLFARPDPTLDQDRPGVGGQGNVLFKPEADRERRGPASDGC